MKLRDLIICAIEFETLQETVAQQILRNILHVLYGEYPRGLPPPTNKAKKTPDRKS